MNRSAAALLILALAACVGATLVQQRAAERGGAPAAATAGAQDPIDQRQVMDLAVVRGPADLGDRALAHARTIVGFGARHSGKSATPGWTQQIDYIKGELQRLGIPTELDTWTDEHEGIAFTNVIATIAGAREERLVLACHHDTKCTQGHTEPEHNFDFVGANDGASAVGLLLAMAPTLLQRQNKATLQLVFLDGEESLDWSWNGAARALFGSKRFVRQHRTEAAILKRAPRIEAMILLDMVGRTDLHIQEELYSTRDLRRMLWSAAVATGNRDRFFRAAEAASDDHVPFLDVGIPAIDLIDLTGNPHWHKPTDTLANISAASMQIVGDVVLTMMPAVEDAYFRAGH